MKKPRKSLRLYKSHSTLALERIAGSLEKIATYVVLLEAGLKQSYQKPINVYMEVDE